LGGVATIYFLFGLAGNLGNPVLNLFAAAGIILAALFFLYAFFVRMPDRSRLGFSLWLLILVIFLAEITLGRVPPAVRDELIHHLAIPKLYLQAGRIIEIPFALHSYYPMLLDMLYTPFIGWGLDSVPKLIHGLFGFLTGLLLFAYLAQRLSPVYGLLGSFSFVSTPIILRLSNLAYVDLGLTFYSTASLLCLLRWMENIEARRWLILAGLSAGFALATKSNGLLVFLLLFFLLVFLLERQKKKSVAEIAYCAIFFSLLAFVPFSPWLLKNFAWTGNPLFPFLGGFFGGDGEGTVLGLFTRRQLLYGESGWQIAALPLRIFFSGQDDNPRYFDGVLTPILILFLPWAFKGKWSGEKKLLFSFGLLYFLYAFFLVGLRIRYILPVVPPLVILLVYGVHNVYLRIARPALLLGAVVLLLSLNAAYLWNYIHVVSPMDYLSGRETKEAYLARRLPDYPALQYINQSLPSKARVYLLFIGNRGYYCERDYFYDTSETGRALLRILNSAGEEKNIREGLENLGITHLLVRQNLLLRFLNDNLSPVQRERWVRFGNRYLQFLFGENGYSVYKLQGKPKLGLSS
jgi:hypothetical protein